jgi:hypothetical protein
MDDSLLIIACIMLEEYIRYAYTSSCLKQDAISVRNSISTMTIWKDISRDNHACRVVELAILQWKYYSTTCSTTCSTDTLHTMLMEVTCWQKMAQQ